MLVYTLLMTTTTSRLNILEKAMGDLLESQKNLVDIMYNLQGQTPLMSDTMRVQNLKTEAIQNVKATISASDKLEIKGAFIVKKSAYQSVKADDEFKTISVIVPKSVKEEAFAFVKE